MSAPWESPSYLIRAPQMGYFQTARFGRQREKSEISEKILPCRPLEFPLHSATQVDWPLRKLQHISNQLAINQIHSLYTTIRFSCSGDCTRRHCLKSDSTNLAIEGEAVDRAAQKMLLDVAYTYGTGVTTAGFYVNLRTSDRRRKDTRIVSNDVLS